MMSNDRLHGMYLSVSAYIVSHRLPQPVGTCVSRRMVDALDVGNQPLSRNLLRSSGRGQCYSPFRHSSGPEKLICLKRVHHHRTPGPQARIRRTVPAMMNHKLAFWKEPVVVNILVENQQPFRRPGLNIESPHDASHAIRFKQSVEAKREVSTCFTENKRITAKSKIEWFWPLLQKVQYTLVT